MNFKQACLALAFLPFGQATEAPTWSPTTEGAWDDWGLCYFDAQCKFSCGDAQSPEDCLKYQQGHPDAPPIDVPYYKGPDGVCMQTEPEPELMGRCCTTCDFSGEYYCTPYWNNPDGCVAQGYEFFYNKVEANYVDRIEDFCYQVDSLGRRFVGEPEDPKTGSTSGDPHFKTWTGEKFDYHGECDLVLIDNPSFNNGQGLKLHIRTKRVSYFSYIERAALQIGDDVLEFANDANAFTINGEVAKPQQRFVRDSFAGFFLRRDKKAISVRLDQNKKRKGGPKIDFIQRKNGFPAVIVEGGDTDLFRGSLGLLGDWETGHKMARDGKQVIQDATEFALEWQVRDTEPMLFEEARFPQFPTQCTPPQKMLTNRLGMERAKAEAEKVCANWDEDKEDCIFDVIATRDLNLAKEGRVTVVAE